MNGNWKYVWTETFKITLRKIFQTINIKFRYVICQHEFGNITSSVPHTFYNIIDVTLVMFCVLGKYYETYHTEIEIPSDSFQLIISIFSMQQNTATVWFNRRMPTSRRQSSSKNFFTTPNVRIAQIIYPNTKNINLKDNNMCYMEWS